MKKRLTRIWTNLPYARQLAMILLGVSILPMLILLVLQLAYTANLLESKTVGYARSSAQQAASALSSGLGRYEEASFQLMVNEKLWQNMRDLKGDDLIREMLALTDLQRELQTLSSYYSQIQSVGLMLHGSGRQVWLDRYQDKLTLEQEFSALLREPEPIPVYSHDNKWMSTSYFSPESNQQYYLISYRQKIIDLGRDEFLGTYVVNLHERVLADICAEASIADDVSDNYLFVTDQQGRIVSHHDKTLLGMAMEELFHTGQDGLGNESGSFLAERLSDGETVVIQTVNIEGTPWYVHDVLTRSYTMRELYSVRTAILGIAAAISVSTIVLSLLVSRSMSRSVSELVSTMRRAELGDLHVVAPVEGQNEMVQIAGQFNEMMATIQRQMAEIREATYREKQAEIHSLEAQINPHFLYNTLDSINWLAIDNNQREISAMLLGLAHILRYRIADSNSLVTVETELAYLEKYLLLQKYRYSDSFRYEIQLEPAAANHRIHKLIFQPFIENSIEHGFEQMDFGGVLMIAAGTTEQGELAFTVEDNGKGMDSEQVEALFYSPDSGGADSIGIPNVVTRLRMYYGERCRIRVRSSPGQGTRIRIMIPAIPEER